MTARRLNVIDSAPHPRYVVWELTLRCDQACAHCGSRAALPRAGELGTEAALRVARELAEQGAREVVLIGGEAYLHPGFLQIVRSLKEHGVTPVMTTGGFGIDEALAQAMAEAGLQRASVSIDGLEAAHDRMRRAGSFNAATAALGALKRAGIRISANTNINRSNRQDLEALYEHLRDAGVESWQVQLTAPLGRAADRPAMLLQPWDLLDLVPRLLALKRRGQDEGLLVMPGNNLGYFGPEEGLLRSQRGGADHFRGCQAGKFVLGIESSGAVKGCPSLPSAYVRGSVAQKPLAELLGPELQPVRELWGFCRECPFAKVCQGGCTFTAHAFFGKPGNNPYCHFRAQEQQRRGLRERLVPKAPAPGQPFDHGRFEIVLEPFGAAEPEVHGDLVKLTRRAG